MEPIVSILVGSGFSIPEGLPGVKQLNKRLSKIDESEIMIHSSQRAFFLKGQEDNNRWQNWDERIFLQEFLEFYNSEILTTSESFHYETFYDFYSSYLNEGENKKEIEGFYNRFTLKHFKGKSDRDCYNRVWDFNRSFSQLLATQLHKQQYFDEITNFGYPLYGSFIGFLKIILEHASIKFHTLNHDLFFDWLGRTQGVINEHFCDGFTSNGSPFYGGLSVKFPSKNHDDITVGYRVKMEHFADKFDKKLAYYKMHGSIFNTVVYVPPDNQHVRLKYKYRISDFYIETIEPTTGMYDIRNLHDDTTPDFLSGTTNKIRSYTGDEYYKNLFRHFESNLQNSDYLFVIGYGFQDHGINEYLEKHYLSRGKEMVVIDPYKPQSPLLKKYKVHHISLSVTDVDYDLFISFLPEEWRVKKSTY